MNEVINTKIKVKPVGCRRFVGEIFEGPCRTGDEKSLSPEGEKARGKMFFNMFLEDLKANLTSDADLLEPVFMAWGKGGTPEGEFRKLEADSQDVDLFLVSVDCAPASGIAQRYKKPVAMMWHAPLGEGSPTCRFMSPFRSGDIEGYVPIDFDELNRLISLLRVRRAVRQSKILAVMVGDMGSQKLEDIKSRYGIDYKCISSKEIFDEMDKVIQGEAEQEKVEEITDRLIKNAQKVHMRREHILQSVNFYVAAKNLMEKYGCNAFSLPCYEICYTKIPAERKVGFCLTHSLLKDEGFPSVCEGDINMLPAMTLLMYISKKSAPMGNPFVAEKKENVYALHHDVPGLKMKGLDEPHLPYEIRNFTVGGWGATIRHDFSLDKGEVVTIATFNPSFTKLLVVRGEIVGCSGFDKVGCILMAHVKVPDVVNLFHKAHGFNHHHAMVYGDYTQELRELGGMMGFEVVET